MSVDDFDRSTAGIREAFPRPRGQLLEDLRNGKPHAVAGVSVRRDPGALRVALQLSCSPDKLGDHMVKALILVEEHRTANSLDSRAESHP